MIPEFNPSGNKQWLVAGRIYPGWSNRWFDCMWRLSTHRQSYFTVCMPTKKQWVQHSMTFLISQIQYGMKPNDKNTQKGRGGTLMKLQGTIGMPLHKGYGNMCRKSKLKNHRCRITKPQQAETMTTCIWENQDTNKSTFERSLVGMDVWNVQTQFRQHYFSVVPPHKP